MGIPSPYLRGPLPRSSISDFPLTTPQLLQPNPSIPCLHRTTRTHIRKRIYIMTWDLIDIRDHSPLICNPVPDTKKPVDGDYFFFLKQKTVLVNNIVINPVLDSRTPHYIRSPIKISSSSKTLTYFLCNHRLFFSDRSTGYQCARFTPAVILFRVFR
jgi:hypothetical protein